MYEKLENPVTNSKVNGSRSSPSSQDPIIKKYYVKTPDGIFTVMAHGWHAEERPYEKRRQIEFYCFRDVKDIVAFFIEFSHVYDVGCVEGGVPIPEEKTIDNERHPMEDLEV